MNGHVLLIGANQKQSTAPDWAKAVSRSSFSPRPYSCQILERLEIFDARFSEMEKQNHTRAVMSEEIAMPTQDPVGDLLEDILFGRMPAGQSGVQALSFGPMGLSMEHTRGGFLPQVESFQTPPGARIQTLSPTEQPRTNRTNASHPTHSMTWGSEVELPQVDDNVIPPGPTINIQAPTESRMGRSSHRVPSVARSGRAPSTARGFAPARSDMPDVMMPDEKDLPAEPAESIRSVRATPAPHTETVSIPPRNAGEFRRSAAQSHASRLSQSLGQARGEPMAQQHNVYEPAQHSQQTKSRDRLHLHQTEGSHLPDPAPWDLLTQRLYSWALVWEDNAFVRALESISLGDQVSWEA